MKTRRTFFIGIVIFLVLVVLIGAVLIITYGVLRSNVLMHRPLVLIHSPLNHEQAVVGSPLIVHATARSTNGIQRFGLWVDGLQVTARELMADETYSPLVIHTDWIPESTGRHEIILRASSTEGVEGQASVEIQAFPAPSIPDGSVSDDVADTEDGGDVEIPPAETDGDSDGDSTGNAPPIGQPALDEPAPSNAGNSPGSILEIMYHAGLERVESRSPDPIVLRAEVISLETSAGYESLHCYIGLAGSPPSWFPDRDLDPSTDESFIALDDGSWDVAADLSGDRAISAVWPGDQPLPIDLSCVGIHNGGSDAVELGQIALEIPPANWDGITRQISSEDGEDRFSAEYRISHQEAEYLDLDQGMAAPDPVWFDDRRQSLRWEYPPIAELDPQKVPHGFLIFLNDTLVWSTDRDNFESRLPEQWLYPPCGTDYVFTVRAYKEPYPEGPYSIASEPVVISAGEFGFPGCDRAFQIVFSLLETGDLGGITGPVYGGIYGNDSGANFDGRCEGARRSDRCAELHLDAHREYALSSWPWSTGYVRNRLSVTMPEDESITIGFNIVDSDIRANTIDNLICHGETTLPYYDLLGGEYFDGVIQSILNGPDGQPLCEVHYSVQPIFGSPIGFGGDSMPLPWLDLEDITVDHDTGQLQFHIRNTGTAAWANQDLKIQGYHRGGSGFRSVNYEDFYLDPGQKRIIQDQNLAPDHPLSYCWELDPDDQVLELFEQTGALFHDRLCPPLPDFTITNADYDPSNDRLLITVQNVGNGSVEDVRVDHRLDYESGGAVLLPINLGDELTLGPWDSMVLTIPGTSFSSDSLSDGYTLTIDPNNHYIEADEENNTYSVRGSARLRVWWNAATLRWYPRIWSENGCGAYRTRGNMEQEILMTLRVLSPFSSRPIASWTLEHDVNGWGGGGTDDLDFYEDNRENGRYTVEFEINGDEELSISWSGEQHNDSLGEATVIYDPEDNWGSIRDILEDHSCYLGDTALGGWIYPEENSWSFCGGWAVSYHICTVR